MSENCFARTFTKSRKELKIIYSVAFAGQFRIESAYVSFCPLKFKCLVIDYDVLCLRPLIAANLLMLYIVLYSGFIFYLLFLSISGKSRDEKIQRGCFRIVSDIGVKGRIVPIFKSLKWWAMSERRFLCLFDFVFIFWCKS